MIPDVEDRGEPSITDDFSTLSPRVSCSLH